MSQLSPDQWRDLSPYLDEALALPNQDRSIWLSGLRDRNPELADQLQILLDEHRFLAEEGFLERHTVPSRPTLAGQAIGVYTLISQIGQGGMGSVWLAERHDGRFERSVAVKFLNLALIGREGEERFRREGKILGLLVHPNIADLVDAGVSSTGQPYLVLDYVEGDHIDGYCDDHQLDLRARIRLFLDVLGAVAHAHANLIVHRDLKPSNVLVRKDRQVKLLDFGIAKLLEREGDAVGATQLTVEGARPMTPEYAAPEQLLGGAITTATDIYALGVLLYLLLTGQHPAGAGARSPADLVRAIIDTEPLRPSEVVLQSGALDIITAATRRSATPDKLRRLLRGDLDTIVAKAMKKEPGERYSSVTALAEDLRRYLRSEPIGARPDTFSYRVAKFVRRNRTAVVLATLAIFATIAGVTGTLVQSHTARVERDFALRQLARAQTAVEFNEFLLSDAAPSGKPFTVNELLGRAEETLARQNGGDEISRVELLASIGDQYSTQDEPAKARHALEEAYALSRTVHDAAARAEADCSLAGALVRDGDLKRAEALIQEGLRELPPSSQYDLDRMFCLRRGSEVAEERGDTQQGISRMQSTWALVKRSPFDSATLELHPLMELAEAYRVAGQNQLADTTFAQAATLLSNLGRDNTQSGVALFNDWAIALDKLGRPLEAEKLFRRAIEISRVGPTEEAVSPILLNNYSNTLREMGRLDQAADYAERAYAKALRTDDQMAIDHALSERALVYLGKHNLGHAASTLTELEPRLHRTFPPDNYWFGILASEQALLASERSDFQTALQLADRAVVVVEAATKAGRTGIDLLPVALFRRSTIEFAAGRPERAAADAQRALTLLQASDPSVAPSSHIGRAYLSLGLALQSQGKRNEANTAFRSAVAHLETTLGSDNLDTRRARQLADATH